MARNAVLKRSSTAVRHEERALGPAVRKLVCVSQKLAAAFAVGSVLVVSLGQPVLAQDGPAAMQYDDRGSCYNHYKDYCAPTESYGKDPRDLGNAALDDSLRSSGALREGYGRGESAGVTPAFAAEDPGPGTPTEGEPSGRAQEPWAGHGPSDETVARTEGEPIARAQGSRSVGEPADESVAPVEGEPSARAQEPRSVGGPVGGADAGSGVANPEDVLELAEGSAAADNVVTTREGRNSTAGAVGGEDGQVARAVPDPSSPGSSSSASSPAHGDVVAGYAGQTLPDTGGVSPLGAVVVTVGAVLAVMRLARKG